MAFFLTKYFWGAVLIVWGLSMIVERLFKIKIPIVRIILGVILITIGSQLMWNKHQNQNARHHNATHQGQLSDGMSNSYQLYFDNQTIDLSQSSPVDNSIRINVMFSSVDILVPDDYSYDFEIQNVMSETALPNSTKAPIGKAKHLVSSSNPNAPVIKVYLYSAMSTVDVSKKFDEGLTSDF
ncbi:MAG TPA: hypothetical protein PKJ08_06340 [Candidatus Cloacimonadota bacterium]|mgnify:FL=1|nr:hypothetical protein [Candidatus Cloacimonadota bacterium]HPM02107.1 hypothetical protein [Candidatus Cloacimonadota bacterium]